MTEYRSPADIVEDFLVDFVARLRARDLDGVLSLFSDEAALFGSEAAETARGAVGLREFFSGLFTQPSTYGWTWEQPVAARHNDILWFVAPATAEMLSASGDKQSVNYRLSGVLREVPRTGWALELFNGSEPADSQRRADG
jgi:ketosteroid isomerase-like protein